MIKNKLAPIEQLKHRELLTVREASLVFGYSAAFVYRKISEGKLSLIAGRLSQRAFNKAWELGFPVSSPPQGKQKMKPELSAAELPEISG